MSAALAGLGLEIREVVLMVYFGDRTYREVAAGLAISEDTVKSRISSGMRQLHVALDDA